MESALQCLASKLSHSAQQKHSVRKLIVSSSHTAFLMTLPLQKAGIIGTEGEDPRNIAAPEATSHNSRIIMLALPRQ
jgi:hypothetical protein